MISERRRLSNLSGRIEPPRLLPLASLCLLGAFWKLARLRLDFWHTCLFLRSSRKRPTIRSRDFFFFCFFFRMQLSDCCQHVSHMKDRNHDPLQHIKDPSFDFPPRSHGCMVMYDIVEVRKIPRKGHALKLSSLVSHSAWKRNRGREWREVKWVSECQFPHIYCMCACSSLRPTGAIAHTGVPMLEKHHLGCHYGWLHMITSLFRCPSRE